ncbi:permease [Sinanaerobacter chloroacetimidivorans]|uniref:Permease n=1 Tax=Sinanaerobacter chloroacetimidivorans TaxID=2818044 RepID=A0A8J8B198_9FIRM|nr:permease [Sinanaerobacter chloroacetimidivorans]MBR0598508.1 permease [Sinanaerobacter chloroacetimidivorans]
MQDKKSLGISLWVIGLSAGYFIFSLFRAAWNIDLSALRVFNTVFISILMQALPFMLVGAFVSSAMHVFLSDEFLIRIFPTKYGIGFLTAMLGGIFFPVCECAIVPVTTGLVKKGVSLPIALTFMFSAPIINPIVIISTLYAFPGHPEVALIRVCFGLLIAIVIGLIVMALGIRMPLLPHENHHGCDCGCHEEHIKNDPVVSKIKRLFLHSGEEFFDVGKYLILGAFITALVQTFVPRSVFENLLSRNTLALLVMMTAAFLFSACSTSDAFIARSFSDRFTIGSIMGFLVFGPMMDIKNMLMLFGSFKKSFVIFLCVLVFLINLIMLSVLSRLLL